MVTVTLQELCRRGLMQCIRERAILNNRWCGAHLPRAYVLLTDNARAMVEALGGLMGEW